MHLAHNTYIWAFLVVLLGSTFGQPSSENAIRDRSPNALRRRSGSGPDETQGYKGRPSGQIPFEKLREMWKGLERGSTPEDSIAWNHWNEWLLLCASYNWDGPDQDHEEQYEWCNREYWRQYKENGARPYWPVGRTRSPEASADDAVDTPTSQQPASQRTGLPKWLEDFKRNFFFYTVPKTSPVGGGAPSRPRIPIGGR